MRYTLHNTLGGGFVLESPHKNFHFADVEELVKRLERCDELIIDVIELKADKAELEKKLKVADDVYASRLNIHTDLRRQIRKYRKWLGLFIKARKL